MASPRRIFLVGPMGAGKTTIGRQLARTLDLTFLDSDREIEHRSGVDIPTIFDFEGEAGFRRRERAMIDELTQRDDVVVATGGGAVLDADNRNDLASRGTVVYLETSVEEQLRRTRHDRKRPLLQAEDRRATLEKLQAQRDPLYREIAGIVVTTDGSRRGSTVERIVRALGRSGDET
ncbi:MAG: shikimate kinase AroK [Halofilum sp. (in: g-proteobacteria)]|nr:shikimate kinase AroK [Halofilum sp. (in: g-proteobacteria)]